MRQVALAIGVGQSGDLVTLEGARDGARKFAEWAGANGFEVTTLIDHSGTVSSQDIYEAVEAAVDAGDVERLFIFFSGHGVSKGAAEDFWLLSAGPRNPNEGVNVAMSMFLAATSGISHVAIFADACRTMAGKDRMGMGGALIFPNVDVESVDVEVDSFFATRSGDPALEVVPDDEAEAAFGIFSEALLEALSGEAEGALTVLSNGEVKMAVTAQSLRSWLNFVVPERSSRLPGANVQRPHCTAASSAPNNVFGSFEANAKSLLTVEVRGGGQPIPKVHVFANDGESREFELVYDGAPPALVELPTGVHYQVEVEQANRIQDPETAAITRLLQDTRLRVKMIAPRRGLDVVEPVEAPSPPRLRVETVVVDAAGTEHAAAPESGVFEVVTRDVVSGVRSTRYDTLDSGATPTANAIEVDVGSSAIVESLATAHGRDHFETGNGLSVLGAEVTDAFVTGGRADWFAQDGAFHVRGETDLETSLIARLSDDRWVAAALLPGFIGTVIVGRNGVDSLSYLPAQGYPYEETDPDNLQEALAVATAAVHGGRFEVAIGEASDVARYLRKYKHQNPTLGVFAAYAYERAGRFRQVRDMIPYFADMEQVVPFDLTLLARQDPSGIRVSPSYPLLTQGWAYLIDEENLHPAIVEARDTLAPSLWATPTGQGGEALARAVEQGDL